MAPRWEKTPFETLEGARQVAARLELNPSSIIDTGGEAEGTPAYRSFQTKAGRRRTIIAQKTSGGPVLEKQLPKGKKSGLPLQDPNAPSFGEEDRLLTGPWVRSDHGSLEVVEAYWRKQYVNFDNVEVLAVTLYRIGRDEYEYAQDVNTRIVWQRVLGRREAK